MTAGTTPGDTAWCDEDGFFWYVGRNDDVIKSSGYRIGPFEIESVMLEHEAVREVAVTGVPDELRGFAVKATVVLAPGFEPSTTLTKELQTWVKHRTAPYKFPAHRGLCRRAAEGRSMAKSVARSFANTTCAKTQTG